MTDHMNDLISRIKEKITGIAVSVRNMKDESAEN
jgi:hypothetical protein